MQEARVFLVMPVVPLSSDFHRCAKPVPRRKKKTTLGPKSQLEASGGQVQRHKDTVLDPTGPNQAVGPSDESTKCIQNGSKSVFKTLPHTIQVKNMENQKIKSYGKPLEKT